MYHSYLSCPNKFPNKPVSIQQYGLYLIDFCALCLLEFENSYCKCILIRTLSVIVDESWNISKIANCSGIVFQMFNSNALIFFLRFSSQLLGKGITEFYISPAEAGNAQNY